METRHVLILGGTGEARRLAMRLSARGDLRITLSLAGRTQAPLPQAGTVRVGGFGGAAGLAYYLRQESVAVLIDVTHPFAARMSANAAVAAAAAGVRLIVLERSAWTPVAGDRWTTAGSIADAVALLGPAPRTVFLAIGRQELAPFMAAPQHRYIVRSVEAADDAILPPNAECILARGPFAEADERRLFETLRVEVLVAKNSGGDATYGKIAAARALGIETIMVRRPAAVGAPGLSSVEAVVRALDHHEALPADRGE